MSEERFERAPSPRRPALPVPAALAATALVMLFVLGEGELLRPLLLRGGLGAAGPAAMVVLGSAAATLLVYVFGRRPAPTADLTAALARLRQEADAARRALQEHEARAAEQAKALEDTNRALRAEATERAQAEQTLRDSEAQYRGLVESSPAAVTVRAGDRLAYLNPAAVALLGAAGPDEVLGRPVDDFIRPNDQARCEQPGVRSELRLVRRDGEWVDVEVVTTTVLYDGQAAEMLLIHDMTGRKGAEAQIAALNADLEKRVEKIAALNGALTQAYDATIEGLSRILDLRDEDTQGHGKRVTELTLRLARALGVAERDLAPIRWGALLHDIGKLGVPDSILFKPDALTEEEWTVMRRHPEIAHEMLASISFLRPALAIPWCHHEKWDGTGYPRGLAGGEIPLAARLFAIADVWDSLRSERPYRPAWSQAEAWAKIESLAGTHFDPQVVHAFFALLAEEGEAQAA